MKDMKKVVEKFKILKEHRIMILGDYDVDGTTSTACCINILKIWTMIFYTIFLIDMKKDMEYRKSY
ncbi:MAG: hypothetical protein CM15mP109_05870 [Candidatus Dadabacteria bacterium]|nr:MAG: hypothetical protein CM15mP109_05870 [Candidatus Dadabacteria bacterium]